MYWSGDYREPDEGPDGIRSCLTDLLYPVHGRLVSDLKLSLRVQPCRVPWRDVGVQSQAEGYLNRSRPYECWTSYFDAVLRVDESRPGPVIVHPESE
jgi:hypothetical protein